MPKTSAIGASPKALPSAATTKKKVAVSKPKPQVGDSYAAAKLKSPLAIGNVREARGVKALEQVKESDGISTSLPLHDLGEISTNGRQAAGFRLDGGSVRGMWVSARRIVEDGKKGFELSFFAHGDAQATFEERMTKLGAKSGQFQFQAAEPKGADGKSALHRDGEEWSPQSSYSAKSLSLGEEGKWRVEYNPGEPIALRGAMRVRVYGTDLQSTKALAEVTKKLGLHDVFASSSKESIEKLKLARFLWQNAHDAGSELPPRTFAEVSLGQVEVALTTAGHGATSSTVKEAKSVDLKKPEVAKTVALMALFAEKKPDEYADWASGYSYGPLSAVTADHGASDLTSALADAGIGKGTAAYKKAISSTPTREESNKALLFAALAENDSGAAKKLLQATPGTLSSDALVDLAVSQGFSEARLNQLRFEEVYPGYFTVVDPAQVEELHKAGARYLYSTYDSSDRVMSMLTGGQKSSYARYSEGLLVAGMSTGADFNSGGATAVFTRLVTKSAIESGKKEKKSGGSSWGDNGKFNDWGGQRPYKVILNESILARTDWWGFNGDNFGKSTDLSAENFGKKLVKDIDSNYDSSNELMFPIGNHPSYADYVVCDNDEQKKELVDAMKKAGFKEYNGKPLNDFVRVENYLFEY